LVLRKVLIFSQRFSDKSKFGYIPGETYKFTYQGETKTSINNGNKEQAGLKFTASVLLEVLSKCELSLKVNKSISFRNIVSGLIQTLSERTGNFFLRDNTIIHKGGTIVWPMLQKHYSPLNKYFNE
jgi:hypothetical protein